MKASVAWSVLDQLCCKVSQCCMYDGRHGYFFEKIFWRRVKPLVGGRGDAIWRKVAANHFEHKLLR
jgi:hypothetical protein